MAAEGEGICCRDHGTPAPVPPLFHHHCHLPFLHRHNHPPLLHHQYLPPPPFLKNAHHHHVPPSPPIPFLCARCKCWNFPANPGSDACFHPHYFHSLHSSHCYFHRTHVPDGNTEGQSTYEADDNLPDRSDVVGMEEDEEEDYEFVMTEEWMEFFAKSEARRQEKKRQQKKAARDLHKAAKERSQVDEPSQHVNEESAPT